MKNLFVALLFLILLALSSCSNHADSEKFANDSLLDLFSISSNATSEQDQAKVRELLKKQLLAVTVPAEPNEHLMNSIYENFGSFQNIDIAKIDNEIESLTNLRTQYYKAVFNEESNSLFTNSNEADKKALEDDLVIAAQVAILKCELLKEIKDETVWNAIARDVLEIRLALSNNGAYGPVQEIVKSASTSMLYKHDISIKEKNTKAQASDLWNQTENRYFTPEELDQMSKNGTDLSLIDPKSTFWKRPSKNIADYDLANDFVKNFKAPQVVYFKNIKKQQKSPKIDVTAIDPQTNKKIKFRMKLDQEVHSDFVAPKLMAAIGYPQDITLYNRDVKMYLGKMTYDQFMVDYHSYYDPGVYTPMSSLIKEKGIDKDGEYIVFHEALFEAREKDVQRIGPWGLSEIGHQDKRAVRALTIINAWINNPDIKNRDQGKLLLVKLPDGTVEIQNEISDPGFAFGSLIQKSKINDFAWDLIDKSDLTNSTNNKKIRLKYSRFQYVEGEDPNLKVTYSDARWVIRLIGKLTKSQIQNVFVSSGWPDAVAKIYTEKLCNRRNQLVIAFKLQSELGLLPITPKKELNFTSEDGKTQYAKEGVLVYDYPESHPESILLPFWNTFYANFGVYVFQSIANLFEEARSNVNVTVLGEQPQKLNDSTDASSWEKVFGDVRLNLSRNVVRNPKPLSDFDQYLVYDTFRLEAQIGMGVLIPLQASADFTFKGFGSFGKEFTHVHVATDWHTGYTSDFFNIFETMYAYNAEKMDFTSDAFQVGDIIRSSTFFGPGLSAAVSIPSAAGTGFGLGVNSGLTYTTSQYIIKSAPEVLSVWKEKVKAAYLEEEFFAKLGYFLKYKIASNRDEVGKLNRDEYQFSLDSESENFKNSQAALNKILKNNDFSLAETLIDSAELESKYRINQQRLNLIFFNKTKEVREDDASCQTAENLLPDMFLNGEFEYTSSINTMNNNELKVSYGSFDIDVDDESPLKIIAMEARVGFYITDSTTGVKEMQKYINRINRSIDDTFIDFNTSADSKTERYGETISILNIYMGTPALINILGSSKEDILKTREYINSNILDHNYIGDSDIDHVETSEDNKEESVHFVNGKVVYQVSKAVCNQLIKSLEKINRLEKPSDKRHSFMQLLKSASSNHPEMMRLLIHLAGIENVYIEGSIEGKSMTMPLSSKLGDPAHKTQKIRHVKVYGF